MKKQIRGVLLLLLTAMIWGSAFVAQKKGMDYIGPFTYCGIRMIIGSIVLLPVIAVLGRMKSKKEQQNEIDRSERARLYIKSGVLCGLCLFGGSIFQQFGLQYTTPGKAGFITALYVVIVPVLGLFMHKKVTLFSWIGVVLAIAGFYLLCIKEGFQISNGDFLVLICAIMFSFHILVIDHYSPMVDGIILSCIQFFVCGSICIILMFLFEKPGFSAIWDARGSILYAAVFSSGVAYTLQIIAQKDVPPVIATLLMSLESVFSALTGWLILHDEMTFRELSGCVIVFIAVILAQLPQGKSDETAVETTNEN